MYLKAPCCINDHNIYPLFFSLSKTPLGDFCRTKLITCFKDRDLHLKQATQGLIKMCNCLSTICVYKEKGPCISHPKRLVYNFCSSSSNIKFAKFIRMIQDMRYHLNNILHETCPRGYFFTNLAVRLKLNELKYNNLQAQCLTSSEQKHMNVKTYLLSKGHELVNSCRPIHIRCDHHNALALHQPQKLKSIHNAQTEYAKENWATLNVSCGPSGN